MIGSIDDISDWDLEQICTYMNQITVSYSIDVFIVGDFGEIDVASDIQSIFSTHQQVGNRFVQKEKEQSVQIEYEGG